ncbi:MAG TPA: TasA family protein [Bacillales bacterium]|nr:TasA family protein [Bacillales bacterium]
MGIKKQLGMGVATAALGLTLVGGGTYAAFNDVATVNNHFAAGELNLDVGAKGTKPISFDLSNMKPGDNVQRIFELNNVGSLAIKEVLLNVTAKNFNDGTENSTRYQFLNQFVIDFMAVDSESDNWEPRANVVKTDETLTLADLVYDNYSTKIKSDYLSKDGRINLAPLTVASGSEESMGIPVNPVDSDDVFIQITFKNNPDKKANGEYVQNKFMKDSIDFFFNLEATQWEGIDVDTSNGNGEVNNGIVGTDITKSNKTVNPDKKKFNNEVTD